MNEIVKYKNDLNAMHIENGKLSDRLGGIEYNGLNENELDAFVAIISRLRGRGTDEITLPFNYLMKLTSPKQHYSKKEYAMFLDKLSDKLLDTRIKKYKTSGDDFEIVKGNIFGFFDAKSETAEVTVSITPKFAYLFNDFSQGNFTRFELDEYNRLEGIYQKLLYMHLKQWSSTGYVSYTLKEFKEIMNIPEAYTTKQISQRIILPSINGIKDGKKGVIKKKPGLNKVVREFQYLRYEFGYKGRKAVSVRFIWGEPKKLENIAKEIKNENPEQVSEEQMKEWDNVIYGDDFPDPADYQDY